MGGVIASPTPCVLVPLVGAQATVAAGRPVTPLHVDEGGYRELLAADFGAGRNEVVALWQVDLDGDGSDEAIAVMNYLDGIGGGAIGLVSATAGGGLRSFVLCRTTEFFPSLVGLMETKGAVALSVVLSDDEGTRVIALQRERPVAAQPGDCVP